MDGLTRVDYPDGNYVSYSYDNACRLTSVTTPFGTTSYEYDLLDRLTRVVDRNGYATVYEYDANGNRTAVHYANGFTTTYEYDLLNRLICEKAVDNEDNVVVQYVYTLGAAGERKSVTELDRTVEYTYDSLYRLTSETITEGEKVTAYTYAYDNVSNRILKTENGAATEYVYNALNQLVSDSETSYEYDLNGNLVRVIGSAQSALYEYNAENKFVRATVQNGVLVTEETYTYDYSGNRTSKTTHRSDGVTEYVKYLNDNSSLTNVLAEIDFDGSVQAYYTIGADVISQERDGKVSVYLYDGHGSVVGLANENGKVTDTYAYDAFGNLLKSKGNTENCYRYCGEQFDETSGLYYLRARYMDTSTGRFISQDSYAGSISDPISLHKYLYANSNPVMFSDPKGFSACPNPETTSNVIDISSRLVSGDLGTVIELTGMAVSGAMQYYANKAATPQYIARVILISAVLITALACVVSAVSVSIVEYTEIISEIAEGAPSSQIAQDYARDALSDALPEETDDRNSVYLYYSAEIINHVTVVHMSQPLKLKQAINKSINCNKLLSGLWTATQEAAQLLLSLVGGAAKRAGQQSCRQYGPNAEKGKGNGMHNAVHYHPACNESFHIWFGIDMDAVTNGKIIFTF